MKSEMESKMKSEEISPKEEEAFSISLKDTEILERIVEAEAGCEDEDGKLLIANVVLNRVGNEYFPDTIAEVVFQKSGGITQFSPVSDGSYSKVKVSEESTRAVERALSGEDLSEGALYFAARRYADSRNMRWFDENLTFLFQHGGHEFFK
ncbi:MAG: cell wall hydrolase, partial [Lachnospiraceae bacterium]|nr:cell wall hydrolase [Lachnospiraceae bacterium]